MDRKEPVNGPDLGLALKVAKAAAFKAGEIQRENSQKSFDVSSKEVKSDLVTEVDLKCEEAIIIAIREVFADHSALAEEKGEYKKEGSSCLWVIDPLDGTVNYAHGFPMYCSSVALQVDGLVEVGAVYDPTRDEMFSALRGHGAFLNDTPIKVSKTETLEESLLATGFPYTIRTERINNLAHFSAMALRAQAIRRPGAAALDLCYTACGRLDGFWEFHLKPWDMAAGALILTEAGGMVSGSDGEPFSIYSPHVAASNGLIHGMMLDTLKSVRI